MKDVLRLLRTNDSFQLHGLYLRNLLELWLISGSLCMSFFTFIAFGDVSQLTR